MSDFEIEIIYPKEKEHKKFIPDEWSYDQSSWHQTVLQRFPSKYRHILVTTEEGESHLADLLMESIVVEIQGSPLSCKEFYERNHFFLSHGYKVVWIFDAFAFCLDSSRDCEEKLFCNFPVEPLSYMPAVNDKDSNFAVWVSRVTEKDIKEQGLCLEKVIWAPNYVDIENVTYNRITVDDIQVFEGDLVTFNILLESHYHRLNHKLHGIKYEVKSSGMSGLSRDNYVCPKKGDKGFLKVFGSDGCEYCDRLLYLETYKKYGKNVYKVYCESIN